MTFGRPFPTLLKLKPDRDGRVLLDRLQIEGPAQSGQREGHEGSAPDGMDPKTMPFDMKKMSMGGFTVLVDA